MDYPTYITLPFAQPFELPEEYGFQDVRFSPELVSYLIARYSNTGDTVLDPFVGFGTTILTAENMGRSAFGIEIDGNKVDYLRAYHHLDHQIIHGDVGRLFLERVLPSIDLVITSPPYMAREDTADALTGYRYKGNYDLYLEKLSAIFSTINTILRPKARVIIEISNLKHQTGVTTLAWDVGKKLSKILHFEGELIVNWTGERKQGGIYNYGYDHSYCLIYSNS